MAAEESETCKSSYEVALSLMKEELPEYIQNIFIASGYDRLESIAKIKEETIDEMITYANTTFTGDSLR